MKKSIPNKKKVEPEKTDTQNKEVPLKIKTSFSKVMRVLSTPKK